MAKKPPTEKQKAYAEARGRGLSREQSAIMAGYEVGEDPNTSRIETSVQEELSRIRAETAANVGITKEQVAEMLVEAANMARHREDPMGLIAAARELGKLLGHYAPEVKRTLHGLDRDQMMKVLEDMPDEELVKIKHGKVIDVKPKRLEPPRE